MNAIRSKVGESASSILPIALLVVLLSITLTPITPSQLMLFSVGVLFLIAGMSVFTAGLEMSMQPLGNRIGTHMGRSKSVFLIGFIAFVIGVAVTFSEPDLQILAQQVPGIPNLVLILTVSVGVGIFMALALLRIVFHVSLNLMLIVFYGAAIALSFFVPDSLRCLAFDSGGVTTGPMTVPFIMSMGAGVCAARAAGHQDDSFGITALCSIGPILSVLILGICMRVQGGEYVLEVAEDVADTRAGLLPFARGLAEYAAEVGKALIPMVVFTVCFQLLTRAFSRPQIIRLTVGFLYAFVGMAIFLTGANVGFLPTGVAIGCRLAGLWGGLLLVPVCMLIGFFIVRAEPSVYVLNKLVEQMSAGAISGRTTGLGLSIGVAVALGLSMLRILLHIPILYILVPGYVLAIAMTFFVPKIFVGIAFDSGGVASGTMMSAFVLPLATGACNTVGGDVMTEAFGCVAFVALTPIITIQINGLLYRVRSERQKRAFITEEETFLDYGAAPKVAERV